MKIGAIVPQGWVGEYDGWDPLDAWRRTADVARHAERLGFESIWLFDHFHTIPRPTDEITFESFTSLSALAALTRRIRLGHIVICTGFRNLALTAKMISTMDTISGGRMELGIGAGWKRDEWLAYGYGFPETKERLERLGDDLQVINRMLEGDKDDHATYEGRYSRARDAINVPKPIQQPRVPIMVGGNGPNVTWRLAARYADELNLDGLSPSDVREALPVIRNRCQEIGRDPATLAVSVHIQRPVIDRGGSARIELLTAYREMGVSRVMGLVWESARTDEALDSLVEDARAARVELA
ncbi:MAG TPA: TIGR03560 family F420-dependent LLM class oxidoreductase [Candidatus Bathyarchaeia archaeon]|jgi:F420-dependent oxidoreductase-like protein|nr:TIGR03560 family F420-dependent LLM class oxidoreductase [Candidatus Bathyarchaeia archaeon]